MGGPRSASSGPEASTPIEIPGFVILDVVATGRSSIVARALDDGEPVALKVIPRSDDAERRFALETRALDALRDAPCVLQVRRWGRTDRWLWLSTEWLDGATLAATLNTPCTFGFARRVGRDVTRALDATHRAGFIHRDLKPSNIFCTTDDRVVLCDFGIAVVDGTEIAGGSAGTPGYMAPEQARGHGRMTPAVDLFALGCVLFECFAGRPAFLGRGRAATLARVLLERVPRLSELSSEVPAAVDELVDRLLRKDAAERTPSALAAHRQLARVTGTLDKSAPPRPVAALGREEQQVMSLVALELADDDDETLMGDDELVDPDVTLDAIAERHHAQSERLHGGTAVFVLRDPLAHELARRAHACARDALPLARGGVAVVTGRARWNSRWPSGEAADEAFELLREADGVQLDPLTQTLLAMSGTGERRALVGRRQELREIVSNLRETVRDGGVRTLAILGPAGLGKTTLVHAFVSRIQRIASAPRVVTVRAAANRRRVSFGVIGALVRQTGDVHDALTPEQAETVSILADGRGFRQPTDHGDGNALRGRVRDAVAALLGEAARNRPVVVVLEDAHWADTGSLAVLASLPKMSVMCLLLTREELPADVRIHLRPLSANSAATLIQRASVRDLPERDLTNALRVAAGHPLLLQLLARARMEDIDVQDQARAGPEEVARVMLHMRLSDLPAGARRVARAAAIMGRTCARPALRHLLGNSMSIEATEDALATLRADGVVADDAVDGVVFAHDLWRDAAHGLLTPEDRSAGHGLAAGWLTHRGAEPSVIASHHHAAGDRAQTSFWLVRAGERALTLGDLEEAARHFDDCDVDALPIAEQARMRVAVGTVALWKGQLSESASLVSAALSDMHTGSTDWIRAAGVLVQAAGRHGDVHALDRVAAQLSDAPTFLPLQCQVAREFFRCGAYEAGESMLERIDLEQADVPTSGSGALLRAEFAGLCATRAMHRGDFVSLIAQRQEEVRWYETYGDRMNACSSRGEVGFGHYLMGEHAEADRTTTEALQIATDHGYSHIEAWLWCNLGLIRFELGDLEAAIAAEQAALSRFVDLDDNRLTGATIANLVVFGVEKATSVAELEHHLGDAERACLLLESHRPLLGLALAARAQAELALGRLDAAFATAQTAIELVDELGHLEEGDELLEITIATICGRLGREDIARPRLTRAIARLEESARGLAHEEGRRRFLESSKARRTLLSLGGAPHSDSNMSWAFMRR